MNKRQRKKRVHKMCVKYQDGYGLMPMFRNPSISTGNVKIFTSKIFNEYIFLQHEGLDFPVDMLYGKTVI